LRTQRQKSVRGMMTYRKTKPVRTGFNRKNRGLGTHHYQMAKRQAKIA